MRTVCHWDRCDSVLDVCCYCSYDWITSLSTSCSGTDCWITFHCVPLWLVLIKKKVGLRGTIELEDQILRCCDSSDDVIERWWSSLVFSWWSLLSFRLVWYWMSDGIAFVRCDWFIASAWHDLYWVIPFIVWERVELKQFVDLICAVHHWDRCDVVLDVCCYCSCDWITSLSKSCSGTDYWITLHCAPLWLVCSYVRLLPLF